MSVAAWIWNRWTSGGKGGEAYDLLNSLGEAMKEHLKQALNFLFEVDIGNHVNDG